MMSLDTLTRGILKFLTARKMDRFFTEREDPYRFRTSPFNAARFKSMEAALGERSYRRALEIGASQGDFTERLAPRTDHLIALEVSAVAGRRAQDRLAAFDQVKWVCDDIRTWSPSRAEFDLIVLADVLYYLEKPFGRRDFENQFSRIESWLAPSGRLLLAHGFLGPQERVRRIGYRERFEKAGLKLLTEETVAIDSDEEPVRCLVSLLEKAPPEIADRLPGIG